MISVQAPLPGITVRHYSEESQFPLAYISERGSGGEALRVFAAFESGGTFPESTWLPGAKQLPQAIKLD